MAPAPVTAADLRALRREIERRMAAPKTVPVGKQRTPLRLRSGQALRLRSGQAAPTKGGPPLRWNPPKDDVQRSVAQLVLTIVEFLRRLMERQAIRRMHQKTLTRSEVEAVGKALMQLEETVREIGAKFGLTAEDLNLDLGPIGKLL